MPFGKISDDFHSNKKVMRLLAMPGGLQALGLWLVIDSWCNDELTDGNVPDFVIARFKGSKRIASLLVEVGLWLRNEDGYQYHDWSDFNDTRESVLEKRAKEATKKGNHRLAARANKALSRSMSPRDTPRDTHRDSPRDSLVDTLGTGVGSPDAPIPLPLPLPLPSPTESKSERTPSDEQHSFAVRNLVRVQYTKRFEQATTTPPAQTRDVAEHLGTIAGWLQRMEGDDAANLARLLDGWFADSWAADKGFPLKALANNPGRYFKPPKGSQAPAKRHAGIAQPSTAEEMGDGDDITDLFGLKGKT